MTLVLWPGTRRRGLATERHWPATSYRRALRICRYKNWGANRQSQWWLGFWLSGETINPNFIRKALKREFSVVCRQQRSFIESDRWRNSRFETVADAERGGLPGETSVAGLLKLFNMTPDQFRRLSILDFDDLSDEGAERLFYEIGPAFLEIDGDIAAEIKDDIAPDEIKGIWRTGYMAEGSGKPGDYIDQITDSELAECLLIFKAKKKAVFLNYACARLEDGRSQQTIISLIIVRWMTQAKYMEFKIGQIIHIAFELYADKREGICPSLRVLNMNKSVSKLEDILKEFAYLKRNKRLE